MRIEKYLKENKIKYLKDYPLSKFTTLSVGGPADYIVFIENTKSLKKLYSLIKKENIPFFIFGRGANLLVSDDGFRGIVLNLKGEFREIKIEKNILKCGSGALISRASILTILNGYWGFENFLDLPGTIGGGLVMNAGCYGKEISNNLISLRVLDKNCRILNLKKEKISFSYRNSSLKNKGIILSADFMLKKGKKEEISKIALEILKKRKENIPEGKSAGSIFKNPENYKARELLKDVGLSGFQIGGAKFSEKHPNIIINNGSARAEDIFNLINLAKKKVLDKFNVKLEEEIVYVGF